MEKSKIGSVKWFDLTVKDATAVSSFYQQVVGWKEIPLSMGEYNDYCMNLPENNETIAGICHARGANANIPPQWLMYVIVENLDESLAAVTKNGGKILSEKRSGGKTAVYSLIEDPGGAHLMLYQE
ncbi:MAG: VOC family protein [Gemmatimonadaceae bacterium]|nr:VOC family protein [Chitinophagaceae bacterium]